MIRCTSLASSIDHEDNESLPLTIKSHPGHDETLTVSNTLPRRPCSSLPHCNCTRCIRCQSLLSWPLPNRRHLSFLSIGHLPGRRWFKWELLHALPSDFIHAVSRGDLPNAFHTVRGHRDILARSAACQKCPDGHVATDKCGCIRCEPGTRLINRSCTCQPCKQVGHAKVTLISNMLDGTDCPEGLFGNVKHTACEP